MNHGIKKTLMALAALAAVAPLAWGFANNLYVGAIGDQVIGYDGLPIPDGSRIEFRQMYKAGAVWKAYGPESELLDTRNPLLAESAVGAGVIPSARGRGKFAACVCGLDTNNSYVVRLFSGPTTGESFAYCDSLPFTYADDDTRTVTNVTFGTWKSMDGLPLEDTDGDGLVDLAEERLSGTDSEDWDSDDDGFSDGFEYTHGMDPRAKYFLDIRLAATPVPEDLLSDDEGPAYFYDVAWPSISGLTYNLEYVTDMLDEDNWIGITNITAIDTNTAVPVDEWHLDNPRGFFRVWTVPPTNGAPAGE